MPFVCADAFKHGFSLFYTNTNTYLPAILFYATTGGLESCSKKLILMFYLHKRQIK